MKMSSSFSEKRQLIMGVALGQQAPDLIIKHANLFNVWTKSMQDDALVLVCKDRIAHIGHSDEIKSVKMGEQTRVLDARGRTLIPGFIDSHTHLAWLVGPEEYVKHVLAHGTTTIITETMEIFPVAGTEGVKDYLAALENQPMRFYATLPAMATIARSHLGIDAKDANALADLGPVIGVGESYWQNVIQDPDYFLDLFEDVLNRGKLVEGHSAGASGAKLSAYAALGVTSCHEPIDAQQVMERMEKGFHVQIREGSIRSDLTAIAPIAAKGVDLSNISLVSDGITPEALLSNGYMEAIVQKAINEGFTPQDAVRMATLNPARHFRMDHDIGSIAPGRFADMVLIPDLSDIRPQVVVAAGEIVAQNQVLEVPVPDFKFSASSLNTVQIPKPLTDSELAVGVLGNKDTIDVRTIEFITDLVTKEKICSLPVRRNCVCPDLYQDIIKAVAVNRDKNGGRCFTGFVKGFGLKQGAIATSAGWDGSEIIALGICNRDLALAINRIREDKGGIVLVKNNEIVQAFALPAFGLLSPVSMEEAAQSMAKMTLAIKAFGCPFDDPLLSLSTLTGAAIPFIRICSEGLVDFKTGKQVSLFPGLD